MSTPFQNRLVGTVIVAMAIIIFVPDVLDGEKKTYQADFEDIPKAPAFTGKQQYAALPQEKLAKLPKASMSDEIALDEIPNAEINKTRVVTDNPDLLVNVLPKIVDAKPSQQADTKTLPTKSVAMQAWVIQLGSFRHQNNVRDLLAKLKKSGYTAFTKPIKTKNGSLTKVFIGPELDKLSLEKKLPALKRLTSVQGKVARFTVTQ